MIRITVRLLGTSNHVLDLSQSDIDGDTSFTLSLKHVKHPGVFERPLVYLSSFFLESFEHTLVDTTKLVVQVAGCCGLAGVVQ
ncbi:hypothetical protein Hanom_Chr03g00227401 [Helianthus anomalus]